MKSTKLILIIYKSYNLFVKYIKYNYVLAVYINKLNKKKIKLNEKK